jgi:hypothetical protein
MRVPLRRAAGSLCGLVDEFVEFITFLDCPRIATVEMLFVYSSKTSFNLRPKRTWPRAEAFEDREIPLHGPASSISQMACEPKALEIIDIWSGMDFVPSQVERRFLHNAMI